MTNDEGVGVVLPERIWIDEYGYYSDPTETSPPNNGNCYTRTPVSGDEAESEDSGNEAQNSSAVSAEPERQLTGLLPCPFCGIVPRIVVEDIDPELPNVGTCTHVLCDNDDCSVMPGVWGQKNLSEASPKWNTRMGVATALPLCPLHQSLEDRAALEVVYGNDCVACSLNERAELLQTLAPHVPLDGWVDSVGFLKKKLSHVTQATKTSADNSDDTPAGTLLHQHTAACWNADVGGSLVCGLVATPDVETLARKVWDEAIAIIQSTPCRGQLGGKFEAGFTAAQTNIIDAMIEARDSAEQEK